MSTAAPKRKPSASPVCYAEEKDIAPGYMWAEHPRKEEAKPKSARPKRRKTNRASRDTSHSGTASAKR